MGTDHNFFYFSDAEGLPPVRFTKNEFLKSNSTFYLAPGRAKRILITNQKPRTMSSLLTSEQIDDLATKINEKVNIPIIGEKAEEKLLEKVLTELDDKVAQHLPDNLKAIWAKMSDGITTDEVNQLRDAVVTLANEKINLPILGEKGEAKVFNLIFDALFSIVEKKTGLDVENS